MFCINLSFILYNFIATSCISVEDLINRTKKICEDQQIFEKNYIDRNSFNDFLFFDFISTDSKASSQIFENIKNYIDFYSVCTKRDKFNITILKKDTSQDKVLDVLTYYKNLFKVHELANFLNVNRFKYIEFDFFREVNILNFCDYDQYLNENFIFHITNCETEETDLAILFLTHFERIEKNINKYTSNFIINLKFNDHIEKKEWNENKIEMISKNKLNNIKFGYFYLINFEFITKDMDITNKNLICFNIILNENNEFAYINKEIDLPLISKISNNFGTIFGYTTIQFKNKGAAENNYSNIEICLYYIDVIYEFNFYFKTTEESQIKDCMVLKTIKNNTCVYEMFCKCGSDCEIKPFNFNDQCCNNFTVNTMDYNKKFEEIITLIETIVKRKFLNVDF
ncbi:hypothetical protein GVAV_002649 [Gurleya vavrai]